MLPIGTILFPTDFSEHSEVAFRVACALARDYDARLFILHVVPPPVAVYAGGVVPPEPGPSEEELHNELKNLEERAHRARAESQLMEGDPVTTILQVAREIHSDVIVMGTHGRTALARLFMGSVAEGVLRKAPCPVLTVKTPLPKPIPEEAEAPAEAVASR